MFVLRSRIDRIDLVRLSPGIVGQHHIDGASDRVRLHVFGPVHRCRAEQIGGIAGFNQYVRLAVEAVGRRQRARAPDQRHPVEGAVGAEFCDKQGAVIEQGRIGGAVIRIVASVGNEFIDIVEALVVTGIDHDAPVFVDNSGRAFVLEAAERRAFNRR